MKLRNLSKDDLWLYEAIHCDPAMMEHVGGPLHAFPPVSNARSNAMCRKMGFTLIRASDFQFRDRTLRCNDWSLDLAAS